MILSGYYLLLVILAALICLVDLTFIASVYLRSTVKKLQKALLLSLACSDFCTGFLTIPFILLCVYGIHGSNRCTICITSYLLHRFISVSSALHLLAVVYERYVKIIHPYWFHSNELTRLRGTKIVPALWFTSLIISATPLTWLLMDTPCPSERSNLLTMYYDNVCLAFFILLVLLMIFAFVRIYLVVRIQLRVIRATAVQANGEDCMVNGAQATGERQSASEGDRIKTSTLDVTSEVASRPSPSPTRRHDLKCITGMDSLSQNEFESSQNPRQKCQHYRLMKEARVITRFAIMVLLFVVVWGPYFYISTIVQKGGEVSLLLQDIWSAVRFLNPLVNPWIVTINNQEFRNVWTVFPACLGRLTGFLRPQDPELSNRSTVRSEEEFTVRVMRISNI